MFLPIIDSAGCEKYTSECPVSCMLWYSGYEVVQFGKNGGKRNSNVFPGGRGQVKKFVKVYELLVVVIALKTRNGNSVTGLKGVAENTVVNDNHFSDIASKRRDVFH